MESVDVFDTAENNVFDAVQWEELDLLDDICIDTHFKLDYIVTDIPEDEESDLLNMCSGAPMWEFKNNNATQVIDEISQNETVQRNVQNQETVNIDTTSKDAQKCQKKNAPKFVPIND